MTVNMCHKNFVPRDFFYIALVIVFLSFKTSIATSIRHQVGKGAGIDKERDALLHFKEYIHKDPHGRLSSWTTDKEANDCCKWSGVNCNNKTSRVTRLDLSFGYLEGKISSSLLDLTHLDHLDLYRNSFSGTIPNFIGSMTQLRYLNLGLNHFTGSIPKFIGSMTHLRYLDLSCNDFVGPIPKFIGFMNQLRYLDLGLNHFTGTIPPELGNLTNLQELSLKFLYNCTIENLDWLAHLSQLEYLIMSCVSLRGVDNWVNVILNLKKLLFLGLQESDLSYVMHPYSYSSANTSLSSNIFKLFLGNNNLNTSMFHWLFPLTGNRLEQLDLGGNKLDWIPEYLGNLCSLRFLYFVNNSSPIMFPYFMKDMSGCTLVTLQVLDGSSSHFIGALSNDIQLFSSLQYIMLSDNQLNGSISEKVWELPNLLFLNISSNSFKGALSKNIGKSKIATKNLSNNSLEGVPIIYSISNLSRIETIDMSSNNLFGPIPNFSSNLVWLDLSNNKLYGGISFLCQIVEGSLVLLDLSNNSLTGQIPDCLWHFKELRVLNLGQNKLSGRLPSSLKYLISLEALSLNNNNFLGEFPLFLKNCQKLTFLGLGVNNFSGHVPAWIGDNLPSLYALSLSSNNFFGTIPLQLCQLENLTILGFSMNKLDGTIPSCLNNLTSMVQGGFSFDQNVHYYYETIYANGTYLHIGHVDHVMLKWQGSAREFSTTLGLVKSIDLSRNNLTGRIPHELTNLHELVALNLSMNALFGEVPPKIGLMKNLLHLDLSRNNLSGHAFFLFMNSMENWVYVKVMLFFAKLQRDAYA
ncbi:uncharacterized protein LOC143580527 [Bidens hawaiensis]|uniref:uncharacterized protein LOC143580527 n=1 Tax=Bidens hawaiensis TaxID=980011 RepID=UPI00404AE18F